ncbi:DUF5107 domain-containing protein [Pontibacter qinzhouensis]|uniref:DUF5107 domain-containing protein n=1 Tax=Pontibacter qinzhouensis TaxID=2603253 RepID=A0A5C8K5J1_9BACT|nr:DUF5107 domain-containing protein [Pontibacter qinzhouensis]TXK44316.1 DUF5107 domain-containing protein [Pontibacter qinzhouensis]
MENISVNVWEEKVIIPTYGIGAPDKNPMFFEKRVYQGSSGVVYPNPVVEKIFDEKEDKEYTGLFLESKYLKIMILPELGGRVQMAFDKIKQRHFIYYNQVIKPALVGLTGPWISGGIEFNWPQHHRPSTFEPVDYKLEENPDGSKTVWVNEVEKMFRTKGMAGFTLHPDKAYLEIKAQLYNRTDLPQTFLWWANPAVKVNDDYQSVFPPDVNAVFDHGKRDVSTFPIATGTYYKVDYSPGTDISRYKNIPVPTSYMAITSDYDFMGGYEHDTQAGVLHVANHHVSPGKKQWTWGHGDFGQAWDRNLTDEDGPYIELMTGVFTDNQPDFSWLMPYEEKSFTQYFMPYRELGLVKNATKDVMVGVELSQEKATIKVFATSVQKAVIIKLLADGKQVLEVTTDLSPEQVFEQTVNIGEGVTEEQLLLTLTNATGRELLKYDPAGNRKNEIPEPAKAALAPAEVETNEQLFLTGQHLEQYRHATYSPVPYYEEALRREPKDARCNNALGAWYLRRGQFAKSEPYFRKAVETLTQRNPNPYDSEPYYHLGLCLWYQDRLSEAYDAFCKVTWSASCQDAAYFCLARIDMQREEHELALEHINWSLDRNARNSKAYVIKAAALRKLNRPEEAQQVCRQALERDGFNLGAFHQLSQIAGAAGVEAGAAEKNRLTELARGAANNYIEYGLDYAAAGLYEEALNLLAYAVEKENTHPMVYYHMGHLLHKQQKQAEALDYFRKAAVANPEYCFPNKLEDIAVLQLAAQLNPADAKAPYFLGNLWYDKRQYTEAVAAWELAAERDAAFPTVFRNLGIAYFNKQQDPEKALTSFEKAFELDTADARVLMELDQLYKRLNRSSEERLAFLEAHLKVVAQRDDVYLERASLYNYLGQFEKAFRLIMDRKFHPWEGGEGKVSGQYIFSLVEWAKQNIQQGRLEDAIDQLELAQVYPHNLGEGKLPGAQENDIFYWLGCAYEGLGQSDKATEYFHKATTGSAELAIAIFYNDQQPDKVFYQGLAWQKLGEPEKANAIFEKLIAYGKDHAADAIQLDYFAVSLPNLLIFDDDLSIRNKINCLYMRALGHLGLQQSQEAEQALQQAMQHTNSDFGLRSAQNLVKAGKEAEGLNV